MHYLPWPGFGSHGVLRQLAEFYICFWVLLPLFVSKRSKFLSRISWHRCFRHLSLECGFLNAVRHFTPNFKQILLLCMEICLRFIVEKKINQIHNTLTFPSRNFFWSNSNETYFNINMEWKLDGNIPWSLRWTNFICSVQVFDPGVCNMAKRSSFVYIWAPDESMCQSESERALKKAKKHEQ